MSDSPYAIRLELLKLSQDILDRQVQATQDRLRMTWDRSPTQEFPELPVTSTEQVIAQAQLLNEFVNKKS